MLSTACTMTFICVYRCGLILCLFRMIMAAILSSGVAVALYLGICAYLMFYCMLIEDCLLNAMNITCYVFAIHRYELIVDNFLRIALPAAYLKTIKASDLHCSSLDCFARSSKLYREIVSILICFFGPIPRL